MVSSRPTRNAEAKSIHSTVTSAVPIRNRVPGDTTPTTTRLETGIIACSSARLTITAGCHLSTCPWGVGLATNTGTSACPTSRGWPISQVLAVARPIIILAARPRSPTVAAGRSAASDVVTAPAAAAGQSACGTVRATEADAEDRSVTLERVNSSRNSRLQ